MCAVGGVSAVVVNWNGRDYLEACLESLLAQDPPPDEILLADNHSEDGSREFVAARYPSVRILDTGANRGPGAARNHGLRSATHDRVLLVDNDVVLEPGALGVLVATLDGHPEAAAVQARSVLADSPAVVHYDAADLHYLGLLVLRHWYVPVAAAAPTAPRVVGAAVALCMVVDRRRCLDAGAFHEEYFFFFEDTDFSWRLRVLGHSILLDPRAVCRHRGGTAELSMRGEAEIPPRRTYYHSRNRWLALLTCLRWRTLILTMPAQLLYSFVHLGLALRLGHAGAWWRGKMDLLRMLPTVLAWRRDLQPRRRCRDRDLLIAEPLTYNPGIAERGAALALRRALDRVFVWHWRLVRWLCG